MKKILVILLAVIIVTSLTSCVFVPLDSNQQTLNGSNDSANQPVPSAVSEKAMEIYFLNFKPEIAEVYQRIATDYESETGVKVNVVTAASGTYETTLKSEIAKAEAPTIFQINGPVGYQAWEEYCADISGTKLYEYLSDKSLAVSKGSGVYGIPYVVEGYGIIYNNAILQKYFSLADKAVSISSADEIQSFTDLKAVVEDMTGKKEQLGIEGVFASTSLNQGEQWRWQTHLANLPLYYEFKDNQDFDNTVLAGLDAKEIQFKYGAQFRNIFDLYTNNSSTAKGLLGGKSVNDSMAEFALGKVAMVQNGNWAWSQIASVEGNIVKSEDIRFMPIYTGVVGEETQGLCIGTENYLSINCKVSQEKQNASIAFLEWLFSSEKGKAYVTNDLGFIAPFTTFKENEKPADPLAREVLAWMERDGTVSVPWTFAAFPSEDFKNYFGDVLLEYVQGTKTWDDVAQIVIDSWKSEKGS